jgi:hypothetical protein
MAMNEFLLSYIRSIPEVDLLSDENRPRLYAAFFFSFFFYLCSFILKISGIFMYFTFAAVPDKIMFIKNYTIMYCLINN